MNAIATMDPPTASPPAADLAAELQAATAAVRVAHRKFGVRRSLDRSQLAEAAETFDARPDSLSAAKRLLDTKHELYRRVTGIRGDATTYWRCLTIPYPEPGIRLIQRSKLGAFVVRMEDLRAELAGAAAELQAHYHVLRDKARADLGALFSESDYPARIDSEFGLDWDFPSVTPPEYLRQLHPELYEREEARIRARFEQAIELAEDAFTDELAKMVAHLAERLAGDVDGKAKTFRDSALANLRTFFDRFRDLSIRSSPELDQLVTQAQGLVAGIDPADLRKSRNTRAVVAQGLSELGAALDGLMVDRAKRAISLTDVE